MIIINFSHPFTEKNLEKIKALTGNQVQRIINVPVQFDNERPFLAQMGALMEDIPLTGEEYQTEKILVNPPALNFITAILLAEFHGRMGYFPTITRLSVEKDSLPPVFQVMEIINLNQTRDNARKQRYDSA